ncbi:MAG: class I SAM-dependent methyltransferase [Vulcanimicrobiota bacterium]
MKKMLIVLALVGLAWAEPHRHHDFKDVPHWVEAFEEKSRDAWQKPQEVVDWLQLRPGQVVADLGAASGYFSRPLARKLGPGGWVFAIEVEPGFFPPLHQLAAQAGVSNIATVLASFDDPHLPDESTDLVFICDTLHHIEGRPAYYEKLKRALKPGGRIAVVDFFPDRDIPVGPKKSERLSVEQVTGEFQAAGLEVSSNLELLPYQYIIVGQKK